MHPISLCTPNWESGNGGILHQPLTTRIWSTSLHSFLANILLTRHKAGHHDTTVHEKVAPAVTHETIRPARHEETTTAIDREVHQDHYHTSVQPIQHREVLPEKHEHNLVGVEHREHHHGDEAAVKARLEQEAARFRDKQTVASTKETSSAAPVIAGEHIHHHVHEVSLSPPSFSLHYNVYHLRFFVIATKPKAHRSQTIQPIVQKETIQPSVVHTTIPIHEVHHNEAKHHSASALPAISMADFKRQGGSLTGREERYDGFEGEPKSVGSALGSSTHGTHGHHSTTAGPHNSNLANKADPRVDSDRDGSRNLGAAQPGYGTSGTSTGLGSGYDNTTGSGYGDRSSGTGLTGTGSHHRNDPYSSTTGPHSSSLGNKADPRVDSDRDGRSGLTGTGSGLTGTGSHHHNDPYSNTTSGPHSSNLENKVDPRVDSDNSRLGSSGHHSSTTDPSYAGAGVGRTGAGNYYDGATTTGPSETTHKKPSLLSRLNPLKDTDGDGKKGVME